MQLVPQSFRLILRTGKTATSGPGGGAAVTSGQGYASGGMVPTWTATPAPRPGPRAAGMPGFSDAGFVAGTVLGYRWWTLGTPPLWENPFRAGWEPGLLRGMRDVWLPGVNLARCLPWGAGVPFHPDSEIPHIDCACGWWGYWHVQHHDLDDSRRLPVLGVIEGTGQVLQGPLGFRAQKARIVALHLPFQIEPDLPGQDDGTLPDRGFPRQYGQHNPWYNHPKFTGRVINIGTDRVPRPLQPREDPPEPSQEEIAEAHDRAEAWMAVIGDRLAQLYPDAEIIEKMSLLLAKYGEHTQALSCRARQAVLVH